MQTGKLSPGEAGQPGPSVVPGHWLCCLNLHVSPPPSGCPGVWVGKGEQGPKAVHPG